jgi:hypothetical protein
VEIRNNTKFIHIKKCPHNSAHMAAAGLDRAVNRWKNVQNFTPDSGQFQPMPFDPFGNGAISCEVVTDELLERLSTFMEQPEAHELLLGPS